MPKKSSQRRAPGKGFPAEGYGIAVDPGIAGTGLALFKFTSNGAQLIEATQIVPNAKATDEGRLSQLVEGCVFQEVLDAVIDEGEDVTHFAVERPAFFESLKGETSARSGSLVKLTLAAGAIYGALCQTFPEAWSRLVPVNEWKGQLSKGIVASRVRKWFKESDFRDPHFAYAGGLVKGHAIDAVGIGIHLWGKGT